MRVHELAAWLEAAWEGDGECDVSRVQSIEDAGPEDVAFAAGPKAVRLACESRAGCLLVPLDLPNEPARTVIRVPDPRAAVARVIARFHPRVEPLPGIHPTAVVGPGSIIAHGATVGPHATIGAGVLIGEGAWIGAGCSIGDSVRIGKRTVLSPNVTVYHDVSIGEHCLIHSGAVIGADGFGFVLTGDAYQKFPQIGRVEIGNHVEIGACSCVDRAALGVTSIGDGTKLDNMVHVGHNCKIGRHVVVAAQTGFSGGVVVEDYAVIGGQVGVGDKARIESRAVVGSGAGILTSKIVRAGEPVWGTPARPLKQHLEQLAWLAKLPRLVAELRGRR